MYGTLYSGKSFSNKIVIMITFYDYLLCNVNEFV